MKFVLAILFSVVIWQTGSSQVRCDSIPEKFFSVFGEKSSDAAIDWVYSTNKYIRNNIQGNLKVKTELKKIISLIGAYKGYELMEKKVISPSYVQLYYLAKFERQPLKFIFVLYKPADKWQLQKLRFDDKVAEEFEKK